MNSPSMGKSLMDIAAPIAALHGGRLLERVREVTESDHCVNLAAGPLGIKSWAFQSRDAAIQFQNTASLEASFRLCTRLLAESFRKNGASQFLPE